MKIKLKEGERIDNLEIKNMKIIQNKDGFCFGMDSILLSNFAKEIKKGARVVDLGTGTGILGLLLCAKTEISEVVGIEIQEEVAEMAQRSIVLNNLEEKFKIEKVDIEGINQYFKDIPPKLQGNSEAFKIFSLEEMERDLKENVEFVQNIFSKIE